MIILKIQSKADSDKVLFPEAKDKCVECGEVYGVAVLEGGMKSGATSVSIMVQLPDGTFAHAQMSAKMFFTLARGLRGACERFSDRNSLESV